MALGAGLPMPGAAQPVANAPPSFTELEAAQARIGEVRVRTEDVFDTQDPKEAGALYRWANALHIQTRTGVIENALLFKRGDPVSVAVIDETERLLRGERYLYDVQIRPMAYQDGVVDIEVVTRDSWTLVPGLSAGRAGGENTSGIRLREYNFLGTGTTLGIGHSNGVDRSSNQLLVSNDRVFGSRTAATLSLASNSDGERYAASVVRPFYSLDATLGRGRHGGKGQPHRRGVQRRQRGQRVPASAAASRGLRRVVARARGRLGAALLDRREPARRRV